MNKETTTEEPKHKPQEAANEARGGRQDAFLTELLSSGKYVKSAARGVLTTATVAADLAAKLTFLDRLKNLSIRTQILSGAGASLILLVLITTITFYSVGDLVNRIFSVEDNSKIIAGSHEAVQLMLELSSDMRGYGLTGNTTFLNAYKQHNIAFDERLTELIRQCAERDDKEQASRLMALRAEKDKWNNEIAQPILALRSELESIARDVATQAATRSAQAADSIALVLAAFERIAQLVESGASSVEQMKKHGAEFIAVEEGLRADKISTAGIVAIAARSSTVTFTLVAVGIGLFILSIIAKNISTPLAELTKATIEVVRGNLDTSVNIRTKNEIGTLARNFNVMVARISRAVDELKEEKESVEQKVHDAVRETAMQQMVLTQSVDAMLQAMERFAEGDLTVSIPIPKIQNQDDAIVRLFKGFNNAVANLNSLMLEIVQSVQTTVDSVTMISTAAAELSHAASEQAQKAKAVSASVESVAASIIENAGHAAASNDVARTSGSVAKEGSAVVIQTVEKIQRIADIVQQSAHTVERLNVSSVEIGEIVQKIGKIANQTNLLALNASIEAARAGAQGKGFAVVADEVSKLAEAATKATKEIADIVKKIQQETSHALQAIKQGDEEVRDGIALAHKANEALEGIVNSSRQVESAISSIARASQGQASTSKHIAEQIEEISQISVESAHGVDEIARSARTLNELTQRLGELMEQFRINADDDARSSKQNSQALKPARQLAASTREMLRNTLSA
jgi:methyl-accepting chemotaxis protein